MTPQHDPSTIIANILSTVCTTATATRTKAEREENTIYTHYEGWLPDEAERPTTIWAEQWCNSTGGLGLVRNSQPRASLPYPPPHAAIRPYYNPLSDEAVQRARSRQPTPRAPNDRAEAHPSEP